MAAPLKSLGLWRAQEGAVEITVPLTLTGGAWWLAYRFLAEPATGRPFTELELGALLGLCAAITGWATSRQMFMLRRRTPWVLVLFSWLYVAVIASMFPSFVRSGFETQCTDVLLGTVVELTPLFGDEGVACQVAGVPGNPYLPGQLYRPSWSASWHPGLLAVMAISSALAMLGFRDKRLRHSKMAARLHNALQLAPSVGAAAAAGKPKVKEGRVQACSNATFWGEICGQIYSADKEFFPGEWCVRCHQVFNKSEREVTFKVVTLFTADVDVLNGLERADTVSWDQGDPIIPDARISATERWVTLGTITLPDVITVAQALSLIHEQVPKWSGKGDERMKYAAKLVQTRGSRVSGWIWSGRVSHRLTYATPSRRAFLAIGPNRLRDVAPSTGEEMTFQLDVGLLPVEMRVGFRKTFDEEGRLEEIQNSKVTIWIPVSPTKVSKKNLGVWVPRVEGKALQTWLATERKIEPGKSGSEPLPYVPHLKPEEEPTVAAAAAEAGAPRALVVPVQHGAPNRLDEEGRRIEPVRLGRVQLPPEPTRPQAICAAWGFLLNAPADTERDAVAWQTIEDMARAFNGNAGTDEPIDWVGAIAAARSEATKRGLIPNADEQYVVYVREQALCFLQEPEHGAVDLIRVPLGRESEEPVPSGRTIGGSIAEWEWLEWEQIQLLRQQCLVMVENDGEIA